MPYWNFHIGRLELVRGPGLQRRSRPSGQELEKFSALSAEGSDTQDGDPHITQ
jgi:hypothetical protein